MIFVSKYKKKNNIHKYYSHLYMIILQKWEKNYDYLILNKHFIISNCDFIIF